MTDDLKWMTERFEPKKLLSDEYYTKHMLLADNVTQRSTFSLPIKETELRKYNDAFELFSSAVHKVADLLIETERTDILKAFKLDLLDLQAIKKRRTRTIFNYGRIDTVLGSSGFRLVEINTRRPQMYEDADWFESIAMSKKAQEGDWSTGQIIRAMESQYLAEHGRDPGAILVIHNGLKERFPFAFITQAEEIYRSSKIIDVNCNELKEFFDLCELNSSDELLYRGSRIDQVIIQFLCGGDAMVYKRGKIIHQKLARSYSQGTLEISSPPSALVSGNKGLLGLLRDIEIQKHSGLKSDENDAIETLLPRTYDLSDFMNNIKRSDSYSKDDYVLKTSGSVSGHGVAIGSNFSEHLFEELLSKAHQGDSSAVVQEIIELDSREILVHGDMSATCAGTTLEPFITYSNDIFKVVGYSTRAILEENLATVNKFNPADKIPEIMFGHVLEISS